MAPTLTPEQLAAAYARRRGPAWPELAQALESPILRRLVEIEARHPSPARAEFHNGRLIPVYSPVTKRDHARDVQTPYPPHDRRASASLASRSGTLDRKRLASGERPDDIEPEP